MLTKKWNRPKSRSYYQLLQFRRENSKNDLGFIVRVHTTKQCQNQYDRYDRPCQIYLLHYRAADAGFDQWVSEMDKSDVVKMEQLATRKGIW